MTALLPSSRCHEDVVIQGYTYGHHLLSRKQKKTADSQPEMLSFESHLGALVLPDAIKGRKNTSSEHFLQTQSNQTISHFPQAYHLATFVSLHLLMPSVVGAKLGALSSISLQGMEIKYSFLSRIISLLCFLLPRTSILVLWGSQQEWGSW